MNSILINASAHPGRSQKSSRDEAKSDPSVWVDTSNNTRREDELDKNESLVAVIVEKFCSKLQSQHRSVTALLRPKVPFCFVSQHHSIAQA
ncbi:hypothetical protein BaRGS_00004292 [Batillaria attramentaria]|uniref:Uncharacterized protein n=1 Tax=Batillaria attramentaria TaxID=370345 RepID=A0ABD0LYX6_9CAEN